MTEDTATPLAGFNEWPSMPHGGRNRTASFGCEQLSSVQSGDNVKMPLVTAVFLYRRYLGRTRAAGSHRNLDHKRGWPNGIRKWTRGATDLEKS